MRIIPNLMRHDTSEVLISQSKKRIDKHIEERLVAAGVRFTPIRRAVIEELLRSVVRGPPPNSTTDRVARFRCHLSTAHSPFSKRPGC